MEKAATLLEANGWPTRLEERGGAPVLVRRRDALLSPRRLTFELLRQAKQAGVHVHLGVAYRGVRGETPEGLLVQLGGEVASFGRILWAGGRLGGEGDPAAPARTHLVLHQLLRPGPAPLTTILELGEAELTLAPEPLRPEFSVLVRMADENPAGGLTWPETPPEWTPLRGPAVRQRLAETALCYAERGYQQAGSIVAFGGLVSWPVCSILGACLEAVEGALNPASPTA
jgi:hypothetical protein